MILTESVRFILKECQEDPQWHIKKVIQRVRNKTGLMRSR